MNVCGKDNLRDSSTSTLTLEAAFERLVKTLLTFFSSLAVSVNLQSRAFSNNLWILGFGQRKHPLSFTLHGQNYNSFLFLSLCLSFYNLALGILDRWFLISTRVSCNFFHADVDYICDSKCGAITVQELSKKKNKVKIKREKCL